MSQRMKLFLLILIINGLLVLIYLVWNLIIRRKEKTLSTWMKAAVMHSLSGRWAALCLSLLLAL